MTFTKMLLALYPALASTIVLVFSRVDDNSETSAYVTGPTAMSYTNVNAMRRPPIAQTEALVPAKDTDPTIISNTNCTQRPLK